MITIKSRTGRVLFTAESAADVRTALREAIESGANLRSADLSGADLSGADLSGADLSGADLSGANLRGTSVLSVTGLPSGRATLTAQPGGWHLTVGCWSGTIDELRTLAQSDDDWPEATGEQITARRPMLLALADMCDAWTAANPSILAAVQEQWTPEGERRTTEVDA